MFAAAASTELCGVCEPIHREPQQRLQLTKTAKLAGHKQRVFDLAWSPPDAPDMLLSAGEDHALLWRLGEQKGKVELKLPKTDVAVARHLKGVVTQADAEVTRCCWHPFGQHMLTGSGDGKIAVWSAIDGSHLASLQASGSADDPANPGDEVYGLECLTNEGLLAAAASDTVQQWDLQVHLTPLLTSLLTATQLTSPLASRLTSAE